LGYPRTGFLNPDRWNIRHGPPFHSYQKEVEPMKIRPVIYATTVAVFAFAGGMAVQAQDHPIASDHAAHNDAMKSPDHMTHAPLARGRNSFTMGQARARLQKAGYSHVTRLAKDSDGLWQGRAMRHGKWVSAAVDYKGNVSSR
jgi:hypothetical protein